MTTSEFIDISAKGESTVQDGEPVVDLIGTCTEVYPYSRKHQPHSDYLRRE
jgi:hypothetical protein